VRLILVPGWGFGPDCWHGVEEMLPAARRAAVEHAAWDAIPVAGRPCVLVGWSLGGFAALAAAAAHPATVCGVLLVAAGARFPAAPGRPGANPRALARMRQRLLTEPVATLRDFARLCGPAVAPDTFAADALAHWGVDRLAAGLEALATLDTPAAPCPVHLLHGTADAVVPVAAAQWMVDTAGAVATLLEGADHALPLSRPGEVARAIGVLLR
jgi:pimeloyl-[acyl-carrier protein] methyl ester esterase